MTAIVIAARIVLATLFAVAGFAKLAGIREWRTTLLLVGVSPRRVVPIAVRSTPT